MYLSLLCIPYTNFSRFSLFNFQYQSDAKPSSDIFNFFSLYYFVTCRKKLLFFNMIISDVKLVNN